MRRRVWLLAILFVSALAFQCVISFNALAAVWQSLPHFQPHLLQDWAITFNLSLVTPFACLLLGFYVARMRMDDARAWLLLAVLISFSVLADGSSFPDEVMRWPNPLRHLALFYRSLAVLGFSFWLVVFAFYFPDRPAFDRLHPARKWLLFTPFALAALAAITIRIAINEQPSWNNSISGVNVILTRSLFWCGILSLVIIFVAKSISTRRPDEARRLRVLLTGLALSFVPGLVVDAIARIKGVAEQSWQPWFVVPALSTFVLFPLTLAYVMLVERALDVGVILRQGLQYAMARRGLVLLQIVSSMVAILVAAYLTGGDRYGMRVLWISCGIGLVFLTSVIIHFVGRWLDRRFFREAYDAEKLLASLAETVDRQSDLSELLRMVLSRLREALHIETASAFIREQGAYRLAIAEGAIQKPEIVFDAASETAMVLARSQRPLWVSRIVGRGHLNELRAELLVPLRQRHELLGFLTLGPRAAEAPYSPREIDLLQSVGQQTAFAIENTLLTERVATQKAQREVIDRELSIAREVQQRLLPREFPPVAGLQGFGTCRPAREVGGDYFDFLPLPDGGLGIAIGDVSGKGVPASLLMASLQASLRGQTLGGCVDLSPMIANVNRLVYSASPENRYATFFYAQFDSSSRELSYVNAGHNPPFVMRSGLPPERLETGGPPVGLLPAAPYQSALVKLHPGDRIVLFTDGISEAMNVSDEEWGEENLIAAIRARYSATPHELAQYVFACADTFAAGAPQHDDMTVVVLSVS